MPRGIDPKIAAAPWLADRQWASGKIRESAGAFWFMWVFALAFCGFGLAILLHWSELGAEARHNKPTYLVLLFPLCGVVILGCSIYQTLRRLKYGRSVLELSTLPGAIGGQFAGTIVTAKPLDETASLRVTLACINRVTTGSGKSQSTTESILWQDDYTLSGRLPPDLLHTCIPVRFDIPADCLPTDGSNPRNTIYWRITSKAPEIGIDYAASFIVPVFKLDSSIERAPVPALPSSVHILRGADSGSFPEERGITLRRDASGGLDIRFGGLRHPGIAITLLVLLLIFFAVAVAISAERGPVLFTILFGVVAFFLLLGFLNQLFLTATISVRPDCLTVTRSMLRQRTAEYSRAQIQSIGHAMSSQAGNTELYRLTVKSTDGTDHTLVSSLTRHDAHWLAQQLATILGVTADSTASRNPFTHV